MRNYLVREAQTIQWVSMRILFVVTSAKGFRVWIVDVKLGYLQSDKPLIVKIFIQILHQNLSYYLKNVSNYSNPYMD